MTIGTSNADDEAGIRQLIADPIDAVRAKEVDRIMSLYVPDVVFYDCKPPFQTKGTDALRRIWEECLPCCSASFAIETRDLGVFVSGDLAMARWLFRFTGEHKDHPAMQTRMRIVKEQCSLPFDLPIGQAVFTLEP